eukprot:gene9784-7003_t
MVQLAGEWICEPSDTHAASAFAFAPVRILHESSAAQIEVRVIEFEGVLRDIFGSPQWLYKQFSENGSQRMQAPGREYCGGSICGLTLLVKFSL